MESTIAIAGCVGHMGATTQSIQAVRVLSKIGYKVCYLEMNRTDYLNDLVNLYANAVDEKDKVVYSGIPMYKRNYAKAFNRGNYDYVVKDYGNTDSDTFEEISFTEQDIKIIVCGSKPNEIFKTQRLLMDPSYDDAFFLFSFVPENERISIKSLMAERADHTFFTEIVTDPFIWSPESAKLFQKIINFDSKEDEEANHGRK